eukprot:7056326-Lingulodinium_polyedra.AAC.1
MPTARLAPGDGRRGATSCRNCNATGNTRGPRAPNATARRKPFLNGTSRAAGRPSAAPNPDGRAR